MTSNIIVKNSTIHGKGVFAATFIKRDSLILNIDDFHVINQSTKLTPHEREHYCDYFDDKVVLWPIPERYINHSCDPNVYIKTVNGVRQVFAMKDIDRGEELTFDYSINGYGDYSWKCQCHSSKCRHTVYLDFFHLPIDLQQQYYPYLDDWFKQQFRFQLNSYRITPNTNKGHSGM
jgi:uncharacterized protein